MHLRVESDPVDVVILKKEINELGGALIVANFALKKPVKPGEEARDIASLIATAITSYAKPRWNDIVVVSGRGPIWLYGLVQHNLHGTVNILAFYDPKLGGAVVVASNSEQYREGDLVNVPEDIAEALAQPQTPSQRA